ncbi:hypothetical protein EGR_00844 [Echinococcus granulosus]|uniref:Uncharacterized protein n=1 Tax=Echinococcus granulosus TaxID=6210 RepID=W6URD7_ECHGR|nr:hypothetical protein EGR_00844 [Echinococcus granulosus]EUB64300.1 hypothetical protein EGR_00844 [Echinococcus granulosus]
MAWNKMTIFLHFDLSSQLTYFCKICSALDLPYVDRMTKTNGKPTNWQVLVASILRTLIKVVDFHAIGTSPTSISPKCRLVYVIHSFDKIALHLMDLRNIMKLPSECCYHHNSFPRLCSRQPHTPTGIRFKAHKSNFDAKYDQRRRLALKKQYHLLRELGCTLNDPPLRLLSKLQNFTPLLLCVSEKRTVVFSILLNFNFSPTAHNWWIGGSYFFVTLVYSIPVRLIKFGQSKFGNNLDSTKMLFYLRKFYPDGKFGSNNFLQDNHAYYLGQRDVVPHLCMRHLIETQHCVKSTWPQLNFQELFVLAQNIHSSHSGNNVYVGVIINAIGTIHFNELVSTKSLNRSSKLLLAYNLCAGPFVTGRLFSLLKNEENCLKNFKSTCININFRVLIIFTTSKTIVKVNTSKKPPLDMTKCAWQRRLRTQADVLYMHGDEEKLLQFLATLWTTTPLLSHLCAKDNFSRLR